MSNCLSETTLDDKNFNILLTQNNLYIGTKHKTHSSLNNQYIDSHSAQILKLFTFTFYNLYFIQIILVNYNIIVL